ncbi:MAG: LPS assembly lipoprotein LptE [Planctomycetota bacterium]|jgi:hypothetical protein
MRGTWPLLLLVGCGYTVQADRSEERLADGSLPRVAVAPFDNLTYRRGLEMRLSRLLTDEIRGRSPHPPFRPDEADWIVRGRITRADERIYSEDLDDRKRESSFVVTVEVVLEERTTEKVLGTYSFTEREPFSTRAGRVTTLEQAAEEALRDIAERIVYWLETSDPDKT